MLSLYCRTRNTLFRFICSAEDLFTLTTNKFRMVYEVDGNPQLDSRNWSMYSNSLKSEDFSGGAWHTPTFVQLKNGPLAVTLRMSPCT